LLVFKNLSHIGTPEKEFLKDKPLKRKTNAQDLRKGDVEVAAREPK